MTTTTERTCTACRQPIASDPEAAFCRVCGTAHHERCFAQAGRCGNPACPGTQAVKLDGTFIGAMNAPGATRPGMMPPPPQVLGVGLNQPIPNFRNEVSLGAALDNAKSAFADNRGLAIGGYIVANIVAGAGGVIPFIGAIIQLLLTGPISGGRILFTKNLLYRSNPQIGDIFAGFQEFGKWLGAYMLLMLIYIACMLPFSIPGIIALIQFETLKTEPGMVMIIALAIGFIVSVIASLIVGMRYLFYLYAIFDGHGVTEAFGESARITEGRRGELFGIMVLLGLINLLGAMACFLGLLYTMPLTMIAMYSLYISCRDSAR